MNLEELKQIKEKTNLRLLESEGYRIVVGVATCGIAAGAKPVYEALENLIKEKKLNNVSLNEVGCIGECALEPIVEVYDLNGNKSTYCKVKPADAEKIINEHIIGGNPVKELLRENYRK